MKKMQVHVEDNSRFSTHKNHLDESLQKTLKNWNKNLLFDRDCENHEAKPSVRYFETWVTHVCRGLFCD